MDDAMRNAEAAPDMASPPLAKVSKLARSMRGLGSYSSLLELDL